MKVISKTLLAGALSLALVACGTAEDNDTTQSGGQEQDQDQNTEDVVEDTNENNTDEEGTSESAAGESSLPVNVIDSSDNELRFELDGEELTFEASIYTTQFNKEVKALEGMTFEYREEGQPAASATFEEEHILQPLTFIVEENLIFNGDNVVTRAVDVERDIHLETSLLGNAGHVNDYSVHLLDDTAPFHFYVKIEGDASKPGNWSEAVRGNDYIQYTFVEVTENGRYYVKLQFPADAGEELEATAIALALSYRSLDVVDTDADENAEEENEENEE